MRSTKGLCAAVFSVVVAFGCSDDQSSDRSEDERAGGAGAEPGGAGSAGDDAGFGGRAAGGDGEGGRAEGGTGTGGRGSGGLSTGGSENGGAGTGGRGEGGAATAGSPEGGVATAGSPEGGADVGGRAEGGQAAAGGPSLGGAESGGAESGGAESGGAESGGAESGGAESGGATIGGSGGCAGEGCQEQPPVAACDAPAPLVDTTDAQIVGNGDPSSCTEARLHEAVQAGGIVRFNCGPDFTFYLTETLVPGLGECGWVETPCSRVDTVIDGEGQVTLDGQGAVRILTFDTADHDDSTISLTVQRLRFVNGNSADYGADSGCGKDTFAGGGAIMTFGGNLTVTDCEFENNSAAPRGPDVAGGAIYSRGLGKTTVSGSVFRGNSAATGGAIGLLASSIEIANSILEDNQAVGEDCGGNGGAIYMDGSGSSTARICGTTITHNVSTLFGGAMFRTAYSTVQTTEVDRCNLDANSSTEGGGAFYLQGTPVTLTNSTVSNHQMAGGAVWILDHNALGDAPGILNMTNVTITGNHNSSWGASGITLNGDAQGVWQNITVADNLGDNIAIAILVDENATATVTNSILQSCYTTLQGDHNLQNPAGDVDCTSGIITADPRLQPLADNGGPTPTRAPAADGPAAGAGAECAPTDQRGLERAASCTLGAVELR